VPILGLIAMLFHTVVSANAGPLAAGRPALRIIVVAQGSVPVDRQMLADVTRTVRDIWRPYADLTFESGGEGVMLGSALRLVVTDRTSTLSDPASLGWIEFIDGQPFNTITVSVTAARTLLQASRWGVFPKIVQRTFLTRALARAIAHEIGHYLLASREHAARGLMRGQLTADDIMQPLAASYRLGRSEVARLRRGVQFANSHKPVTTIDTVETKEGPLVADP